MSGPFRFEHEAARSPLDRSAAANSTNQQLNYKTNVNRMKTTKWVQAKKNAYDGDDWGEYDEYDEYGVNNEPEPEPAPRQQLAPPTTQRYYAQQPEQQARNFTDPAQQAPLPKGRRNSFEHGEEQRAFSSQLPASPQGYTQPPMPPPLQTQTQTQTRVSPMPAASAASPSNTQFPPRKSSVGPESPGPASPRSRTGSPTADKPLPFIRPADIYKRVHEERERERASLDSSRPSLDSLSGASKDVPSSPQAEAGRSLQPLETVAERKSEYLPDFDTAFKQNGKQPALAGPAQPQPPQQDRSVPPEVASVFNNDFWSSGPQLPPPTLAPVEVPPKDNEFRSVVDQAFTRTDDTRSIPPTPISKESLSEMSRSNTDSTTGISPIMSRVPSSATSALKNRNQTGADGSTPVIAEEPGETATPVSVPTTATLPGPTHSIRRKPSPAHSRNSSLPRSGLATPNRGDSPARSPAIAPQRDLPEPEAGQLSIETPTTMKGGLSRPSSAYATREADLAAAVKSSPIDAVPELGAAERLSQNAFLESHQAQAPVQDVVPRDRSESPSKGRVQALAGKFGDVSSSRRGSTQSNASRHSIQSWERSHDHSRSASPTKVSPSKPSSPVKEFRPHLPGQWESYATTVPTPSEHGEREKELGYDKGNASLPLEAVDLTPTTAKRPLTEKELPDTADPMAALRNAGAAMVQSIRSTVGLEESSSGAHQEQTRQNNHGDVYMPRPLQLDRTASSVSSVPPTPPAKDSPRSESPPPPPLKDLDKTPVPPTQQNRSILPPLSTNSSTEGQENDRLREEIVASLSPVKSTVAPANEPNRASLQPASPGANRASSILPSEYDSYWADGDRTSARQSKDAGHDIAASSTAVPLPLTTQPKEPVQSALLNRFSWEPNTLGGQGQTPIATPTKTSQEEKLPSPVVERAVTEERQRRSEDLPEPYFGPSHTITVVKPDPTPSVNVEVRSSTPPPVPAADSLASPIREHTRSPGLHVVNTRLDPEAVELPARLSADYSQVSPASQDATLAPQQSREAEFIPSAPISPIEVSKPPVALEPTAKSPTTDKPLGAREIATITSTSERIATYNKTRDHWATTDHGLDNWLSSTLEANPDLASQTFPLQRPPSGTVRHKHTPSLSILGKLGGSSSHQMASPEHYSSAGAQTPANVDSPTAAPPSSSGFGGRVSGQQIKGKDLLHSAGVLSGKGMTSAKGLFAKGKSRFGRDKASSTHSRTESAPSSRAVSEEPEFIPQHLSRSSTTMTTTPERSVVRSFTTTDSPDEKRRRRFSLSSTLRHASRSRSRPASMALSSNTPAVFGAAPRDTPTQEVSDVIGEDVLPTVEDQEEKKKRRFSFRHASRSRSRPASMALPSDSAAVFGSASRDEPSQEESHIVGEDIIPTIENHNEKKRRRFSLSSTFRRASRSRSRPASMVLPSSITSMFSNTPRTTPSREVSHILGEDNRPHSYHAPDSWNFAPGMQPPTSIDMFNATPPRQGSQSNRLGILPSPAKSAFSSQDKDIDQGDIPPVPPIPDMVPDGHRRQPGQDDTSHRILQSVIRHSTPHSQKRDSRYLTESPVLGRAAMDEAAYASDEERAWEAGQHGENPHRNEPHVEQDSQAAVEVRQAPEPVSVAPDPLPHLHRLLVKDDEDRTLQTDENLYTSPATLLQQVPAPVIDEKIQPPMPTHDRSPNVNKPLPSMPTRTNDDEDDDEPPRLDPNPHPVAFPAEAKLKSLFASPLGEMPLDLSDDEDDGQPRGVDNSRLVVPGSGAMVDDVSPLLRPVRLPLDDVPDEDVGFAQGYGQHDEHLASEPGLVGAADDVVLNQSGSDSESKLHMHKASEDAREHSMLESDSLPRPRSSSPEMAAPIQSDVVGVADTRGILERPAYETEVIGAGDVSPISSKAEDEEATPRAKKAGYGLRSRWRASSDLQPPKTRSSGVQEGSRAIPKAESAEYKEAARNPPPVQPGQIGEIAAVGMPEATRAGSESADQQSTRLGLLHVANIKADPQTRRVSATPFHVVHAVQENADAASISSLASWDRASSHARTPSASTQADEMRDESDLATPVAPLPRITHGMADKAEQPYHDAANMPMHNGYFQGHGNALGPMQQSHQLQASKSEMQAPERSRSLISQISAMVPDGGNPISPASSTAGRSTPSTIRRMQRDSSTRNPMNPGQILEESSTTWSDHTPTQEEDDFDLYADQNGEVKALRNENGQPLRVADAPVSGPAQRGQPIKSGPPNGESAEASRDDERPRYSTERPMSFISGPTDSDGKPQDQINQFGQNGVQVPPVPEQYRTQPQQPSPQPIGTAHTTGPSVAPVQPQNYGQLQHPTPSPQPSSRAFTPQDNRVQPTNLAEQRNVESHVQTTSPPPQDSTPPPKMAQGPLPNGPASQNGQVMYGGPQDPRMYNTSPRPPGPPGPPAPGQVVMPDHDPRVQGPHPGPRNEYEFHQQAMQRQQQHLQGRGPAMQTPPVPPQQPSVQPAKPQEKHSSKPRLSSMFKAFGSKAHASTQRPAQQPAQQPTQQPAQQPAQRPAQQPGPQTGQQFAQQPGPQTGQQFVQRLVQQPAQQFGQQPAHQLGQQPPQQFGQQPVQRPPQQPGNMPPTATNTNLRPQPGEHNRNGSFQSAVSSLTLSADPPPGRPGEQTGPAAPVNRPPSMGAESHFSQVSQGSTRVQPTDSRVDLRKPASPAPHQGIPPQQHPQHPQHPTASPGPNGLPQQYRQALGPNGQPQQFGPNGQPQQYGPNGQPQQYGPNGQPLQYGPNGQPQPPRAASGVPELGKKKRLSTFSSILSQFSSTGPKASKEKKAPKAQRNASAPLPGPAGQWPSQQQQQYRQQPGMAYRPGEGPPQPVSGMNPRVPQHAASVTMSQHPPQRLQGAPGMPQQYHQSQQGFIPQQPMTGASPEQASAYMRTKQLAEEHRAQQNTPGQGPQPGNQPPSTFSQNAPQSPPPNWSPPPQGHYEPQTKPSADNQGAYASSPVAQQQGMQQQPLQQSLSQQVQQAQQRALQQQQALQQRRQESIPEEGAYSPSPAERAQLQQRHQSVHGPGPQIASHTEHVLAQQRQRPIPEQGVYPGPQAERNQALQQRQPSTREQGGYGSPQLDRQQAQIQRQPTIQDQGGAVPPHVDRQQAQIQRQPTLQEQGAYGIQHPDRQQPQVQRQPTIQEQGAYGPPHPDRQQPQRQLTAERVGHDPRQMTEQQRQQPGQIQARQPQQPQQHQQQVEQQRQQEQFRPQPQPMAMQAPPNQQSISGPPPNQALHANPSVAQRHVSSPMSEPQYEAPPIPAAYRHVSGAFISPLDHQQQPLFSPPNNPTARPAVAPYGRQYSDPHMPPISPQVSAQAPMPPNHRTHSDASTVSVVSPVSNSPAITAASLPPGQSPQPQKQRMSSISEVRQQERPFHMNFPEGATEQEIVRARQKQYMQTQFTAHQQQHAERAAQSPSPRASPQDHTPTSGPSQNVQEPVQGGGFKELLPRASPQPYPSQATQSAPQSAPSNGQHPMQVPRIHPEQSSQPADYPLPMSPESANTRSPVNPLAGALAPPPPPKVAQTDPYPSISPSNSPPGDQQQRYAIPRTQQYETPSPPAQQQSSSPPPRGNQYEQPVPNEPPPSYDGPGSPNDGVTKGRERPRPPNITTDTESAGRGRAQDPRQRQPSIGILQHPQPASMAASPQRSSADMGAEALRRQLLQQEERERMERLQRAQVQRAESDRERQEREIARARARELERSASGGGSVGSLRSVTGSRNGGTPGWERHGSVSRPVFELPALEDDEPDMKATSYPGQEWVPPMWTEE